MKHIKLFENFEEDDYFKLIENEDLDNLFSRLVSIENGEFEKIQKLFSDKYTVREEKCKNGGIFSFIKACRIKFSILRIWKLEDDWYLVSISDSDDNGRIFFKCDQFDGLENFLKTTLVK
jgi:hypothetical protein